MSDNRCETTIALESMDYGKQKKDGSHDHRFNTGNDRTRSQKDADKKRRLSINKSNIEGVQK
ncbi:hypothetical protein JFL47_03090 [Haemophilus haemoglobinophilus]|nr:hypothetical protein [Canicola haemoglobinophilus]